jgi:aminoglycoside phosphotransferase (APT) family kinase protein
VNRGGDPGAVDPEVARVREGLTAFLRAELGPAEAVEVAHLARISSVGNAREPWSVTARWRRDGRVHERRAVMLVKAEAGQLETGLGVEFGVLRGLEGSGVPAPPALWLDETGRWIGRPFFATELVPGTADSRALRVEGGDPAMRSVALDLARAAARLHGVDWRAARIDCLPPVSPSDAAGGQLAYWEDLFRRQRLEPHPALVYAFAWLRRDPPVAERVSIVHGDLRFGNLLHDQGRLTALLDWEMVHLGDPIEDLGWVYRALWSPARSLPFEEFLAAYGEAAGRPVDAEHLRWYQLFSEVKHSVISLTAARSFHEGRTPNLRMADRSATVAPFMARFLELLPPC